MPPTSASVLERGRRNMRVRVSSASSAPGACATLTRLDRTCRRRVNPRSLLGPTRHSPQARRARVVGERPPQRRSASPSAPVRAALGPLHRPRPLGAPCEGAPQNGMLDRLEAWRPTWTACPHATPQDELIKRASSSWSTSDAGSTAAAPTARAPSPIARAPQERLRQVVLAANLGDRAVAAKRREHELDLLLRRELPIPALVAQQGSPDSLSGPCSRARRTRPSPRPTGRSDRVRSPSTVNALPGSRPLAQARRGCPAVMHRCGAAVALA